MTDFRFDRRLHAARPDLADSRLRQDVHAERYVSGRPARVVAGHVPLRARPDPNCSLDTELLWGETVRVFEDVDGWTWCQNEADGYVGYCPSSALKSDDMAQTITHRVAVAGTFVYSDADLKRPVVARLSMGTALSVVGSLETRGTCYLQLADDRGWVVDAHVQTEGDGVKDPVVFAERFLNVPYLWGGRTGLGLDCSALVQIALLMTGAHAPRDSDMQEAGLGEGLGVALGADYPRNKLRRGDLIFWAGHVGIMQDQQTLLHANGYHMMVAREDFSEAERRIADGEFGEITMIRRMGAR